MPNSISQNLQRLMDAKTAIASAITARGGTVTSGDGFEEFPSDIATIPGSTYAFLFVTTDEGVTITVSKGQTTLPTQTCVSGEELLFEIPESGTWTVSGSNSISDTISINSQGSFYIGIIPHTYGVIWDKSSSTTLTRTDESANFSDPNPYYAGMSGSPSSPFDNRMPWSGMVQETIDGNVLVKIPKYWYKITDNSNGLKFQISTVPQEGFSVSPAHSDRGDGSGERDFVYVGRYKCNSDYGSTSGDLPITSIGREVARDGCRKQGSSSNIDGWYQQDFSLFWTIRMLYLVEFANWNSQNCIGYGCSADSSIVNTGYTDSMSYHTGTIQSSRTVYGNGTQYRYIEGLWDNILEWVDGIYFISYNSYVIKNPNNFNDSSNGIYIGGRPTATSEIKSFYVPSTSGYDWALFPSTLESNSVFSTYISDCYAYNNRWNDTIFCTGGTYDRYSPSRYGLFYFGADPISGSTTIGTRLMYIPPNN